MSLQAYALTLNSMSEYYSLSLSAVASPRAHHPLHVVVSPAASLERDRRRAMPVNHLRQRERRNSSKVWQKAVRTCYEAWRGI